MRGGGASPGPTALTLCHEHGSSLCALYNGTCHMSLGSPLTHIHLRDNFLLPYGFWDAAHAHRSPSPRLRSPGHRVPTAPGAPRRAPTEPEEQGQCPITPPRPVPAVTTCRCHPHWTPSCVRHGRTPLPADARVPSYDATPARRARLAARFPGERLVIPAGALAVRSNDTDHRFRPHTGYAWLTGLTGEDQAGHVLVLEPDGDERHEAVLYLRPRSPRIGQSSTVTADTGSSGSGAGPTWRRPPG